jgi:aspartate aminotransferase-like enzyme
MSEELLMIPGPTNLPPEVREAIGRPTMYHRGAEFAALLDKCNKGLQAVFQTANDVLILSSSGTGGVEAAIVNLISPDDRVLVINGGKFGERMAEIATTYGALVTTLDVEAGKAAEPQQVADILSRQPFKALLMVQNETSTGVAQNVASLARIAQDYGCLTIVDTVSGMAGIPVKTDEWGLDAVVAGSQKAFMLPPGLAFVTLSPRAWQVVAQCKTPRFYFDLTAAKKSHDKGQTPFTPAVNLIQGLGAALDVILAEGMEHVYARHAAAGRACRAAARALGLELFADPAYASNVVTAVASPAGVDSSALTKQVRADANIIISGGQGDLKGKIFRIGHLGTVTREDLVVTIEAVALALGKLGFACDPAAGAAAAKTAWEG